MPPTNDLSLQSPPTPEPEGEETVRDQAIKAIKQHVTDEAEVEVLINILGLDIDPDDLLTPLAKGFDDRARAARRRRLNPNKQ